MTSPPLEIYAFEQVNDVSYYSSFGANETAEGNNCLASQELPVAIFHGYHQHLCLIKVDVGVLSTLEILDKHG